MINLRAYESRTDMLRDAVKGGLDYLVRSGVDIPNDVLLRSARLVAVKMTTPATYRQAIVDILTDFFKGGNVVSARNEFKRAAVEALTTAFDRGYEAGGGELPTDEAANEWLNNRLNQELGYIEQLFVQAREIRKEEVTDTAAWTQDRADGYYRAVEECYNVGKMFAVKGQLFTWHLGDTNDHCATCSKLDGKAHRASWYIAHDYIPGKAGANLDCGGYRCRCYLTDRNGDTFTL